jgi:hypothetical protein
MSHPECSQQPRRHTMAAKKKTKKLSKAKHLEKTRTLLKRG